MYRHTLKYLENGTIMSLCQPSVYIMYLTHTHTYTAQLFNHSNSIIFYLTCDDYTRWLPVAAECKQISPHHVVHVHVMFNFHYLYGGGDCYLFVYGSSMNTCILLHVDTCVFILCKLYVIPNKIMPLNQGSNVYFVNGI